jgi:threonine dehydrogenase-like Zn-dependent dehydrogenase
LEPILSGVCGSDMAVLTGHASAVLSPFSSFPAVLGHEVVARVAEIGSAVTEVEVGDRVVLDPMIGCVVRGLPACERCAAGWPSLCLRAADGELAPGMLIGFCRDLPGAWSDELQAHRSRVYPVPAGVSDEAAVLVEPFAVALHAVLTLTPAAGERVLVVGGGTVGLCAVAALHLVAPGADVTVLARHPAQVALAMRLGATRVVGGPSPEAALAAAVEHAGASRHRPLSGPDTLAGGFDLVFETGGTQRSLDAALRSAAPRARVSLLGGLAVVDRVDLTLTWARELDLRGSYVYGREDGLPGRPHTIDYALRLLAEHPEQPLGELVTHRYRLEDWPAAMRAVLDRRRSGAVKVVFIG